jgi:hypothetical protein
LLIIFILHRLVVHLTHIKDKKARGVIVISSANVVTIVNVPNPSKGVCGDPVNGGAILEGGGPGPPGGNKECQLSPDKKIRRRQEVMASWLQDASMHRVDLFGPIEYQQHVKKRQVGKGWGVMFVCTTSSALHVEFMDTYSTDSFLMALRRFMGLRGTPTRFQSDRGEQLVAAAKQVSTWDFKEVKQWAGKKGIEWTLVPTGGQHFNGQAERMIGLIKKQLWKTFEGKKLSHEETLTLLV